MRIRGVFFDLDGTLAHTAPDMLAALNRMRAEEGMAPLEVEAVRDHISAGATCLLRKFLCESEEQVAAERARYLDYYERTGYAETSLFTGMPEALDAIESAGAAWGIVTNKPHRYAEPVAARIGVDARIACLVCPEHCAHPKPAPDPLLLAMRGAGLEPAECAYIGDDWRDQEAAQAAGFRFIAAGWGYWTAPASEGAEVAPTPAAMADLLFGREGR